MGVKLFAWVGGLALFLGVVFAVKYSFEHNLISPAVRVALGFLTGIGLIAAGVVLFRRKYAVPAQTLCATGVVILYAAAFAGASYYHLLSLTVGFALMVLITATAFILAIRLDAQVVAVLGLLGGFLTPILLSTGEDNPGGLFSYVALLDAGLIAVAFNRRWHFLTLLSALGTVLMQLAWAARFFAPAKVNVALAVLVSFDLLFTAAFALGHRLKRASLWLAGGALVVLCATLAFDFFVLSYRELGARPGIIFSFGLCADLCLLALVLLDPRLSPAQLASGLTVFLLLVVWTTADLN